MAGTMTAALWGSSRKMTMGIGYTGVYNGIQLCSKGVDIYLAWPGNNRSLKQSKATPGWSLDNSSQTLAIMLQVFS